MSKDRIERDRCAKICRLTLVTDRRLEDVPVSVAESPPLTACVQTHDAVGMMTKCGRLYTTDAVNRFQSLLHLPSANVYLTSVVIHTIPLN